MGDAVAFLFDTSALRESSGRDMKPVNPQFPACTLPKLSYCLYVIYEALDLFWTEMRGVKMMRDFTSVDLFFSSFFWQLIILFI
jgi:hypothetical protein